MNWEMVAAIAETVGAAGVIGSVLYLAAQVRHGARATRRATAHHLNQSNRDLWAQLAADKGVARVWRTGLLDYNSLDEDADSGQRIGTRVLAHLENGGRVSDLVESYQPLLGSSSPPVANSATLDELKSTGNLRLLRSAAVRQAILDYSLIATAYPQRLETTMRHGREPLALLNYRKSPFEGPGIADAIVASNRYNVVKARLLREWRDAALAASNIVARARNER